MDLWGGGYFLLRLGQADEHLQWLKGDDEQRVGRGGGKRWRMEKEQRECCTNNNQWRSVWGRAADSTFLNDERNEKLEMRPFDYPLVSSLSDALKTTGLFALHFITECKKMKRDRVSGSPIEYRKDDRSHCSTQWRAASSLEDVVWPQGRSTSARRGRKKVRLFIEKQWIEQTLEVQCG